MSNIFQRKEKVLWHDILISQKNSDQWTYENAKMEGPSSIPAKPARQSVKIETPFAPGLPEAYRIKIGGAWAADDTLKITLDGSDWKTFTAKVNPTIASMQFSAGGTGAVIVQDILSYIGTTNQPTNWKITGSGDELILTYKTVTSGKYATITASSTAGTAVITNIQNYAAGDTITISGTTYTCVSGASTSSGTTEFEPTATAGKIAEIIADDPLTISNFTITNSGDKVLITQTTAGAGTLLTSSDVTCSSATGKATLATEQAYAAAVTAGDDCRYDLVPGDPVKLVSTDSEGVRTVAPIDATVANDITAFCGFVRNPGSIGKGETETLAIASNPCRLDTAMLPKRDAFGNEIDWSIASGTIGKAAADKGFRFGKVAVGG